VESIDFRVSHGFKPETISMQPELAAVRMPGVGRELVRRMGEYAHLAVWAVQIRARSQGTVRPGFRSSDRVRFTMSEDDMRIARSAVAFLTRLMFESGAREVWPGIFGVPAVMKSIDEARALDNASLDPRCYSLIATHLFGAARMGRDPRASVVGCDFATHAAEHLYVVDSSVFPTNLGVNPQHSIMAMSRLAAMRVAERGIKAAA
jgi:choline dehydrogenase-like flavoprotein